MVPAWLNSVVTVPNSSVAPFTAASTCAFIGNVGDEMRGDPAGRLDRRCRLGGSLAVAVDDRHLGAFGREQS